MSKVEVWDSSRVRWNYYFETSNSKQEFRNSPSSPSPFPRHTVDTSKDHIADNASEHFTQAKNGPDSHLFHPSQLQICYFQIRINFFNLRFERQGHISRGHYGYREARRPRYCPGVDHTLGDLPFSPLTKTKTPVPLNLDELQVARGSDMFCLWSEPRPLLSRLNPILFNFLFIKWLPFSRLLLILSLLLPLYGHASNNVTRCQHLRLRFTTSFFNSSRQLLELFRSFRHLHLTSSRRDP